MPGRTVSQPRVLAWVGRWVFDGGTNCPPAGRHDCFARDPEVPPAGSTRFETGAILAPVGHVHDHGGSPFHRQRNRRGSDPVLASFAIAVASTRRAARGLSLA